MKSFYNIFTTLFALCALAGMTACTDSVDYSAAGVPETAQVYFSSQLSSTVNLSQSESTFDVEVRRIDKTAALAVELSVVEPTGMFDIPTSINFAAGEDVAKLVISYNPEEMEYDDFKDITVAIANADYQTPYGGSIYTFKAGVPAPWESLGTATFSDTYLFEAKYKVELQQHMLDKTRYRLVDPYSEGMEKEGFIESGQNKGNQTPYLEFRVLAKGSTVGKITTTMDNLVIYNYFDTGFYHTKYAEDVFAVHPYNLGMEEALWKYNVVKQLSADGVPEVVQLAPYYYLFGQNGGWDYTQEDGVITIVFPGIVQADYSLEVSYAGRYTDVDDKDYAVAGITLGEDITSAKVAMIEGKDVDAAIAAIKEGTLETQEISGSGNVSFPCEASGTYSFVVVAYNGDADKATSAATFKFKSSHENADTWKSLGKAAYTDDFMAPLFELDVVTYEVEVQESEQNPGKFRLVDPYGAVYPYNEPGDWDNSKEYYLEINATDPTAVYIEQQASSIGYDLYSYAAYFMDNGKTPEEVKAAGYFGTYVNGVISFPANSLIVGDGTNLYPSNMNGEFKVVMPGSATAAISKAVTKSFGAQRTGNKTLNAVPVKISLKKSFSHDAILIK